MGNEICGFRASLRVSLEIQFTCAGLNTSFVIYLGEECDELGVVTGADVLQFGVDRFHVSAHGRLEQRVDRGVQLLRLILVGY